MYKIVSKQKLYDNIVYVLKKYTSDIISTYIADKIILAELMNVPSHGLHYFIHSISPHLLSYNFNKSIIKINNNIVYSLGNGGVGYYNLHIVLEKACAISKKNGIGLAILKNPGKIGALRVYCQEYMDQGQLIIMMKNTARTLGTLHSNEAVFGTNPLCIGLPNTRFIYDSSMSTVATNKLRLVEKKGHHFDFPIGVNSEKEKTTAPEEVLQNEGFLLPFSDGPLWFKSFFLAMAIEGIASLAGGKTSKRVGEHKGKRLYSEEGMLLIMIDKGSFPDYQSYLSEIDLLIKETEVYSNRIPGHYSKRDRIDVFLSDWEELERLCKL